MHFSIPSEGAAVPAPAAQASLSQVLDFGSSAGSQGSFEYDRRSGQFTLAWGSLAKFDIWRLEQQRLHTINLCLVNTEHGMCHFSWRRIYRCSREGSGGIKPYEKKYPGQIRKFSPKWIGCQCKVDLKAYPDTNILLGCYNNIHDHPIGTQNLIYTQVSQNAKGEVKALLEQQVERLAIVCNHRFSETSANT
jgi:hypothetical protein